MPRKPLARRLSKADDATIPTPPEVDPDNLSTSTAKADDDKKPWETDADDTSKADDEDDDDDEDEDDDDTSKADCDDDDDKPMGKSRSFKADLEKAVRLLARHGEQHDPALRKEALMAKEMRGGGLSKSERSELVGHLQGREVDGATGKVIGHQAPGAALRKSMVANDAVAESYDNVTKSITAQAQHLDGVCKSMSETNYLMARVLTKSAEAVTQMLERQDQMASAIESLSRQPAHGPRSAGLGWAEKSFGGNVAGYGPAGAKGGLLEKSSPDKVRRALNEMIKSTATHSESRQAFTAARDSILLGRPLMPSVAAKVEQHLAETAR